MEVQPHSVADTEKGRDMMGMFNGKTQITIWMVSIFVAGVIATISASKWVDAKVDAEIDVIKGNIQEYFGKKIMYEERRHREILRRFDRIDKWTDSHIQDHLTENTKE